MKQSPHSEVPGLGDSAPPIFSKARKRDSENSQISISQQNRLPHSALRKLFDEKAITPPNCRHEMIIHIRMRHIMLDLGMKLWRVFFFTTDALLEHVCLFHPDVTVLGFRNVEAHSKHCWKSLVNDGFRMKWAYLSSFRFMVQNWLLDKFSIMAIWRIWMWQLPADYLHGWQVTWPQFWLVIRVRTDPEWSHQKHRVPGGCQQTVSWDPQASRATRLESWIAILKMFELNSREDWHGYVSTLMVVPCCTYLSFGQAKVCLRLQLKFKTSGDGLSRGVSFSLHLLENSSKARILSLAVLVNQSNICIKYIWQKKDSFSEKIFVTGDTVDKAFVDLSHNGPTNPSKVGSREEVPLMILCFFFLWHSSHVATRRFGNVPSPGRAEIETAPGERVDRPGTLAGVCASYHFIWVLLGFMSEVVRMLEQSRDISLFCGKNTCDTRRAWNMRMFFTILWKKRCPLHLPEVTSGPIWLTGTSP